VNIKNLKSKPRLMLLGASGMIAAGAFAGTTVISHAATPSTPSPAAPAQVAPAPTETPDTAGAETPTVPEKPEANEPALAGGGHNDTGATADHQFDGVE
jgi:hypothetical protein